MLDNKSSYLPLVTVVIPVYNSEQYLRETLESVANQTYSNIEVIVVNDASTDRSMDIIHEFSNRISNLKIIDLKKNEGVSNARNIGIKNATGNFVAFLDSDDIWKKNKIEVQVDFMLKNHIDFSYSSYEIESKGQRRTIKVPSQLNYESLLDGNPIACFTVMCSYELIKKYSFQNKKHEDYILWLSIAKETNLYGISDVLGVYRKHEGSISSNKLKSAMWVWNIYRNEEFLGYFPSLIHFARYSLKGIKKHL